MISLQFCLSSKGMRSRAPLGQDDIESSSSFYCYGTAMLLLLLLLLLQLKHALRVLPLPIKILQAQTALQELICTNIWLVHISVIEGAFPYV